MEKHEFEVDHPPENLRENFNHDVRFQGFLSPGVAFPLEIKIKRNCCGKALLEYLLQCLSDIIQSSGILVENYTIPGITHTPYRHHSSFIIEIVGSWSAGN